MRDFRFHTRFVLYALAQNTAKLLQEDLLSSLVDCKISDCMYPVEIQSG